MGAIRHKVTKHQNLPPHLPGNAAIGVSVTHVPYRAAVLATQDMVADRVDYACPIASITIPQIKGGLVKPIAIIIKERSTLLPDLASAREQALDVDGNTWSTFFAQGTPAAIVKQLNGAIIEAMNTPEVEQRVQDLGVKLVSSERRSPDYLASFVRDEIEK